MENFLKKINKLFTHWGDLIQLKIQRNVSVYTIHRISAFTIPGVTISFRKHHAFFFFKNDLQTWSKILRAQLTSILTISTNKSFDKPYKKHVLTFRSLDMNNCRIYSFKIIGFQLIFKTFIFGGSNTLKCLHINIKCFRSSIPLQSGQIILLPSLFQWYVRSFNCKVFDLQSWKKKELGHLTHFIAIIPVLAIWTFGAIHCFKEAT